MKVLKILEKMSSVENKTNSYIDPDILAEIYIKFIDFTEKHPKLIINLYTFLELALVFNEIEIFDKMIKVSDSETVKLTRKQQLKVQKVVNYNINDILSYWMEAHIILNLFLGNTLWTKNFHGNPHILGELELKKNEPKEKITFFFPKIYLYDLEITINYIIKTLLGNGDTKEAIQKRNIINSVYKHCRIKDIGM